MSSRLLLRALCAALMVAATGASTSGLMEATRSVLPTVSEGAIPPGWVPVQVPRAKAVVPGLRPVTLLLKRRNLDELDRRFWGASDPKSPEYGEHFSTAQMRALVSPGTPAVQEVLHWLESAAAIAKTSVRVAPHEDSMTFNATATQMEALFGVQKWEVYASTTQQRTRVIPAPDRAITIPAALASIVETVAGLADFPLPSAEKRPAGSRKEDEVNWVDGDGPNEKGLWSPQDIWQHYNLSSSDFMNYPLPSGVQNNAGFYQSQQSVSRSDLKTFCSEYNISDTVCTIEHLVHQQTTPVGSESDMDGQILVGVGQRPLWVWSYNDPGQAGLDKWCDSFLDFTTDVLSEEQEAGRPNVITISYGLQEYPSWCSGIMNRFAVDLQKIGLMGISVLSGSGDSGSAFISRVGHNDGHLSPSFPADCPFITAVGATKWQKKSTSQNTQAIDESGADFSGGGFSWNYSMPTYQQQPVAQYFANPNVTLPNNSLCTWNYSTAPSANNGRATPDITALGVQIGVFTEASGWFGGGGTSASGPLAGGLFTQLNNVRLATANKTMGFLNPFLYQNSDCFLDITQGVSDPYPNHPDPYPNLGWHAAKGWDPISGLGSPNFECLVNRVEKLSA